MTLTLDTSTVDMGTQTQTTTTKGSGGKVTTKTSTDRGLAGKKKPQISTKEELAATLREYEKAPDSFDIPHLVSRARALGMTSMLRGRIAGYEQVAMETTMNFDLVLGDVPGGAPVLCDNRPGAASGVKTYRVPFYVGNSVATPMGLEQKVYFPAAILAETVAEGRKQLSAGKQPLTVYARHSHALDAAHLPIGRIVALDEKGPVGYADVEIAPTVPDGANMQTLLETGMVNAVSLRSLKNKFEQVKVDGETMLECKKLTLAGLDFAPDGPALPTYGVQILNEAAVIEAVAPTTPAKEDSAEMDLTLEAVKARPDIVSAITQPLSDKVVALEGELKDSRKAVKKAEELSTELKDKVTALETEVATARAAKTAAEIEGVVNTALGKVPADKRDAAKELILEAVKDCATATEAKAAAFELLLESGFATAPTSTEGRVLSVKERMTALFTGRSASVADTSTDLAITAELGPNGMPLPE